MADCVLSGTGMERPDISGESLGEVCVGCNWNIVKVLPCSSRWATRHVSLCPADVSKAQQAGLLCQEQALERC